MTPHPDITLPEDPAALKAVIAALRGELAEAHSARRIAELGLQAKTLEAERLRVQIARLRHERFGRSSERLASEVEQLELRLDEVLADIAATSSAGDTEDEAPSAPAPEEKAQRRGRRPLPENLPRRNRRRCRRVGARRNRLSRLRSRASSSASACASRGLPAASRTAPSSASRRPRARSSAR